MKVVLGSQGPSKSTDQTRWTVAFFRNVIGPYAGPNSQGDIPQESGYFQEFLVPPKPSVRSLPFVDNDNLPGWLHVAVTLSATGHTR